MRGVLAFLRQTGLAEVDPNDAGRITAGPTRLHLPADSPFGAQTHINWRLRAAESLQRPAPDDFHYSSVVSAAPRDLPRLRDMMIRCIEEMRSVIRQSPEEDLFCYSLDLFGLKT